MNKHSKDDRLMRETKKHFTKADTDGDGQISKEEWYEVLRKAGSEVTMEDVIEIFKVKDTNLNGKLSWEEFCGEKTKTEIAFNIIDRNHDGYITKQEFADISKKLTKEQVDAAFKKFDQSHNNKLDYKEFCDLMNNRDRKKESEKKRVDEIKKEEEANSRRASTVQKQDSVAQ